MTMLFTLEEAETKLAALVELVERGEEVVIEREGKPPIYLSETNPRRRKLGVWSKYGPMSDPYLFLRPDPELEAAAHDRSIFPPFE